MAALASGNELLHGEAVNIDMALTTEVRLGGTGAPFCCSAAGNLYLNESILTAECALESNVWSTFCAVSYFVACDANKLLTVFIRMLVLQISCNRGLISPAQRDRVFRVMNALQLPMRHGVCNTALYMKVRLLAPLNARSSVRHSGTRLPSSTHGQHAVNCCARE